MIKSIVLIGSGRVAHHLGHALYNQGLQLVQIVGRNSSTTAQLALELESVAVGLDNLQLMDIHADMYIIAVSDSAIAKVSSTLAQLLPDHALVVHTSGATPLSKIDRHFKYRGVFYPLQTFSRDQVVDFREVPICLDTASTGHHRAELERLAQSLSRYVVWLNEEQRAVLHLAAVFVNNFTNHLFGVASQILASKAINFSLLKPLIAETIRKLDNLPPPEAQTGPAVRNDQSTIEKHQELLQQIHPEFLDIYQLLTRSIQDLHSNDQNA
ncbi:MAG: DUF2520 domain-containing protein [Saprospiraceae bacterium]|nr:DUF2520 domain-containing protein [Saprospiraceae bacterium]